MIFVLIYTYLVIISKLIWKLSSFFFNRFKCFNRIRIKFDFFFHYTAIKNEESVAAIILNKLKVFQLLFKYIFFKNTHKYKIKIERNFFLNVINKLKKKPNFFFKFKIPKKMKSYLFSYRCLRKLIVFIIILNINYVYPTESDNNINDIVHQWVSHNFEIF